MPRNFDEIMDEFFESYDLQFGHIKDGKYNFAKNEAKRVYYSKELSVCLDMKPLAFVLVKVVEEAEFPNKINPPLILQAYRQISGRVEGPKQANRNSKMIQELEDRQKEVNNRRAERQRMAEIVDSLPKRDKNELAGRVMNRIESKNWHFFFAKKLSAIKANGVTPFLLDEMAWLWAKENNDLEFLSLVPKSMMDFGGEK